MHNVIDNLNFIQNEIKIKIKKLNFSNYSPKIIAASIAVLVGYFAKNVIATILSGLISYWIIIFLL